MVLYGIIYAIIAYKNLQAQGMLNFKSYCFNKPLRKSRLFTRSKNSREISQNTIALDFQKYFQLSIDIIFYIDLQKHRPILTPKQVSDWDENTIDSVYMLLLLYACCFGKISEWVRISGLIFYSSWKSCRR